MRRGDTGPWKHMREGRDHTSGDSFMMTGSAAQRHADIYITAGDAPESAADYEFVANARQDVPRLLDEVERLRRVGSSDLAGHH